MYFHQHLLEYTVEIALWWYDLSATALETLGNISSNRLAIRLDTSNDFFNLI